MAEDDRKSTYDQWMEAEGIPVVTGYYVQDMNKLPVGPWERKGGSGSFIKLEGHEDSIGAYICEIPAGKELKPQKHLFEELILILGGRGATTVWNEGGPRQTFEWGEGTLFAVPLNSWHQHFNTQGDRSVRYLGVTGAPPIMNIFRDMDFIFDNPFLFKSRYNGEEDYFISKGTLSDHRRRKLWEVNFIPDVRTVRLYSWEARGAGGTNIRLKLANNTMEEHISEFPPLRYKKGHRHGPGANVIILSGTGFSLMWPEGQPKMRIDWQPGSLFVPPRDWFHQHFNTGGGPARYLALRTGRTVAKRWYTVDESLKAGGDQIEYEDEDPEIRKMFEQELAKQGLTSQMPPIGGRR